MVSQETTNCFLFHKIWSNLQQRTYQPKVLICQDLLQICQPMPSSNMNQIRSSPHKNEPRPKLNINEPRSSSSINQPIPSSTSCQTSKKESSSEDNISKKMEFFQFGQVCFEELDSGKIKCGVCQIECIRLMSHLNGSQKCSQYFNLGIFKSEYTK